MEFSILDAVGKVENINICLKKKKYDPKTSLKDHVKAKRTIGHGVFNIGCGGESGK